VLALNALGVAGGNPDGTFDPGGYFTREDAMVLAFRTLPILGIDTSGAPPSGFADAHLIAGYAAEAVNFAVPHGIARGNPDGTFDPKGGFRRVDAIAMLNRLDLDKLPKK
jgi:hypothetical protein